MSSDDGAESSVSEATDERKTTRTTGDDSLEQSSDDVDDSFLPTQLGKKGSSDSETSEASDKDASKGDDSTGETVDRAIPPEQETIRDRLEKAGVRTGNEPLMISCGSWY